MIITVGLLFIMCITMLAVIIARKLSSNKRLDYEASHECSPVNSGLPKENSPARNSDADDDDLLSNPECYRTIFERAGEAIFIMHGQGDSIGNIITCNQAAAQIHGYSIEELSKMNIIDLNYRANPEEIQEQCKCLLKGEWIRNELMHTKKNGELIPIDCHAGAVELNGHPYIIAFDRDVSDRKQVEDMLNYVAYYDNLTGLPNRMLLIDRLKLAITQAHRDKERLGIFYLDIDNFKAINSTLGNINGDNLLQSVAERLQVNLREGDTVARLGDDEFALLIPRMDNDKTAAKIAEKVLNSFKVPFLLDGREFYITASIGISIYPDDTVEAQELIQCADTALNRAKETGNNDFRFYAPAMNDKVSERLSLESNLRRALERDEFILYYQPQVDIETKQILGVEALLRWQSPESGMIQPLDFIPIAEETGLIVPIGAWVIDHACKQNKAWQDQGYDPIRISVNISARQFLDNIVITVTKALSDSGLDPKYLELELTESILMHDIEDAIQICNHLKDMGITLSIDDFGTGYSSLSYLKCFPLERLKIDRMFISAEGSCGNDTAIVKAIIAMAHSLNLTSIAEGVETNEQFEFLKSLNCREIQGFLFSQPLPASEIEEFFTKNQRRCA